MNKITAQIIDRFAVTLLPPRFEASDAFKSHNLYLLDNPPHPPKRLIKTPKLFLKRVDRRGSHEVFDYAFPSLIQTPHLKNNTVYGKYFKTSVSNPISTVILLHDIRGKNHRYQDKHALNLVKNGHDCLTITLPHHIERAIKRSASGKQFLSTNLRNVFEALQQAVKDTLALVNWLTSNGEKRIGLLGIGLGGLIASYVASATRKLNYMIILAPATNPLQITGHTLSGKIIDGRISQTGLSKEQILELTKPWELQEHKPHTANKRTLVIEAVHDAIIPSDLIERTWEAWGKPPIRRYRHGHLTLLASRRVFRDINKFLDDNFAGQRSAGVLR